MQTSLTDSISFSSLRIKVKGNYFKSNPESKKEIINTIKNNSGFTEFFKNHNGKIVISAEETENYACYKHPDILQKFGKPPIFYFKEFFPKMELKGTYSRAFALRNLFKKPVWFNASCGGCQGSTWDNCMNTMVGFINIFGEKNSKHGKDLFSIEKRRLLKEKP